MKSYEIALAAVLGFYVIPRVDRFMNGLTRKQQALLLGAVVLLAVIIAACIRTTVPE